MHGGVQRNLTIWVTWQVSCKKQALITLFEHLWSSSVSVASLFSFLCFLVFCFTLFVFVMCLMYPMLTVCLENWRHNQERTMQRHRKHWTHDKDEQSQKENKKKKKAHRGRRAHAHTHTHTNTNISMHQERRIGIPLIGLTRHIWCSVRRYLKLFVVSYLRYLCVQHILCCAFAFFLSFWVPYVVNFSVLWILDCGRWLLVLLILVKLMTITVQNFLHYNTSTYRPATTICLHVTININGIWIIWKYCVDATSIISWNIATVQRIYCSELI